jgi:mycothiol system anti-sigma-R factor
MSCGKPHETPCSEVLARVYEFIDNELPDADCTKIRQHLDECWRCLEEYGLDEAVKAIVRRACGWDIPPGDLRQKVLARIHRVHVDVVRTDVIRTDIRTEGSDL